ncbi:MAG: tRNA lysidine(34) synthetase TilS [Acidobacteria bacterium]|nr:tRNA lysidine(34) synthetase TilS [Acidobacteriota bacterium]
MPPQSISYKKRMGLLEQQALRTIEEHGMILPGERVAVACSGGADSTALLTLLVGLSRKLGCVVSVAHFNHQLRASDSDADEQFVRALAAHHGIEFFSGRADVGGIAGRWGANLEATARKLRYEFLRSLLATGRAHRVATGHTLDDQAETVLLRLLRGTGSRGLTAIRPILARGIIRPLIEIHGQQLRTWLSNQGVAWREDLSNQSLQFRRNVVRLKILPALAEMNPNIVETLAQTARLALQDEQFWDRYLPALAKRCVRMNGSRAEIDIHALKRMPKAAACRLLRWAIGQISIQAKRLAISTVASEGQAETPDFLQIQSLYHWSTSRHPQRMPSDRVSAPVAHRKKPLSLPSGIKARKTFLHLILEADRAPAAENEQPATWNYCITVSVPMSFEIPGTGMTGVIDFIELAGDWEAYNREGVTLLDYKLVESPLVLRNWRPGDAYQPVGRTKPRKLKELFQRHRVPIQARATWPVLESCGQIVWSLDFGAGVEFPPQPKSKQALRISVIQERSSVK